MFGIPLLVQVGCITNGITQEQLDAAVKDAVDAALAENGCLTEEQAAALYQPIGDYAASGDYLTQSEADASYAPAPADGESYVTTTDLDSLEARVSAIEADFRRVKASEVWTVDPSGSGDYVSLHDAVAALDSVRIDGHATVTLQLVGDHTYTEPVYVHHPDGGRVRIVGDTSNPAIVTATFNGSSGIVVDAGSTLGYLGDLTLIGDQSDGANGLSLLDGSGATIGPLVVDSFGGTGVVVSRGSSLLRDGSHPGTAVEGWLTVSNSGGQGVAVVAGSSAFIPWAVVTGSDEDGFSVEGVSFLSAAYARSEGNGASGFLGQSGSFAYLAYASSIGNGGYGYRALYQAGIDADYSGSEADADYSYAAADGSLIMARYSTVASGTGGYSAGGTSEVSAGGCDVQSVTNYAFKQSYNGILTLGDCTGESAALSELNDVTDFMFYP